MAVMETLKIERDEVEIWTQKIAVMEFGIRMTSQQHDYKLSALVLVKLIVITS